jgi:hypothetical protein
VIQVHGSWTEIDPTQWRSHYDCTVNVGLGTGSREETRSNLQFIGQIQQSAAQAGIVQPENVYNLVTEMVETLGYQSPQKYFTDPSTPQFQQQQAAKAQHGDPKVQAAQIAAQAGVQKAQVAAQSDAAHLNMESQMKTQDLILKAQIQGQKMAADAAKAQQDGNVQLATAYLNAKQKHDEAIMAMITNQGQSDAQERQNFVNAIATTSASTHGAQQNG